MISYNKIPFLAKKSRSEILVNILFAITAVAITCFVIYFKQSLWCTVPLYVSLFISLLQSKLNRLFSLIGCFNAVLYAITYFFFYKFYGQAAYALFFSCPLQLAAYINWSHRPYGKSVVLKKLSNMSRVLIGVAFAVLWVIAYGVLSYVGSSSILLDNTVTLLGILATVLMMLAYLEYTVLTMVGNACGIVLYLSVISEKPESITFLIFTVYALICNTMAAINAHKSYKLQNGIASEAKELSEKEKAQN